MIAHLQPDHFCISFILNHEYTILFTFAGPHEHPLWKQMQTEIDRKTIYYNMYTGR